MLRLLCCLVAFGWCCQCLVAGEQASTNANASVVTKLVEELVSPIGPPPEYIKNYGSGKTDAKKREAYLNALSQGWIDPRVASARKKLFAMGTAIFPELVNHLNDDRYSCSFCFADWVDYPVGQSVEQIMAEVVEEGFNPYSYKSRRNATGSNGQPSFREMMREIGAKKYADHVKGMTAKQVQKEFVEWYMQKEKSHGFENKLQEQDILGPCLKRLSEL